MRLAAAIFLVPLVSGLCQTDASGLSQTDASGLSQTDKDALRLLREVNATAKNLKSWRAEGVEVSRITTPQREVRSESHFVIAVQPPLKMRQEHTGDENTLAVCDGAEVFYWGGGTNFYRSPAAVEKGCGFLLTDFYQLEENPVSAAVLGRDHVQLSGGRRECDVVREEWNNELLGGAKWHYVRTLCIDSEKHLILRDQTDATDPASAAHSLSTRTFSLLEGNPDLPPGFFTFSVPTGVIQDVSPVLSSQEPIPVNGIFPVGGGILYPTLKSKVEPVYTSEARVLKISGLTLVSLDVDNEGSPQHVKVIRGLGHGLEEKAVDAVSQWRFAPVTKDGTPISVGPITVAINFRLP